MRRKRNDWIGGLILIGLGLLFLLNQLSGWDIFSTLGTFIVLGLGLIFLVWGVLTREPGLMIPGGILSGIGAGIVLIAGPFAIPAGYDDGAVFLGSFAVGWALITLFSAIFSDKTQWWALIPALVFALISGALLQDGSLMVVVEWLGKLWPVFLIFAGLVVLFGARKGATREPDTTIPEEETEAASKLKTE